MNHRLGVLRFIAALIAVGLLSWIGGLAAYAAVNRSFRAASEVAVVSGLALIFSVPAFIRLLGWLDGRTRRKDLPLSIVICSAAGLVPLIVGRILFQLPLFDEPDAPVFVIFLTSGAVFAVGHYRLLSKL